MIKSVKTMKRMVDRKAAEYEKKVLERNAENVKKQKETKSKNWDEPKQKLVNKTTVSKKSKILKKGVLSNLGIVMMFLGALGIALDNSKTKPEPKKDKKKKDNKGCSYGDFLDTCYGKKGTSNRESAEKRINLKAKNLVKNNTVKESKDGNRKEKQHGAKQRLPESKVGKYAPATTKQKVGLKTKSATKPNSKKVNKR